LKPMRGAGFCLIMLVLLGCARSGEPEASPDRTINVSMRDDNTYDPPEITIGAGEAIRFVVNNQGALRHEFLIGTPAHHDDHEKEMAERGGEHAEHGTSLPGVVVDSGKMADFVFTFPSSKDLIFGCHEPGHFAGGMKGNFRYEA
jgi:uncharacterized cupredoxin-like copper-binding protein